MLIQVNVSSGLTSQEVGNEPPAVTRLSVSAPVRLLLIHFSLQSGVIVWQLCCSVMLIQFDIGVLEPNVRPQPAWS